MPKFSTKWLDSFKAKHNSKKYRQFGKARAYNLIVIKKTLQVIWKRVNLYIDKNMHNIDKSILL